MLERSTHSLTGVLYRQSQLPVLQNHINSTGKEARNYTKGEIEIVQGLSAGLMYNAVFPPECMVYDSGDNDGQSISGVYKYI